MNLYILRHAIAELHDHHQFPDDSLRPLTDEGIKKMKRAAQGMKSLDLTFDLLLSSPYLRAKQTAEIVAEEFRVPSRLEYTVHLEPGGSGEDLIRDLVTRSGSLKSVLLVGHEPYLSGFISNLLTGGETCALTLKKGGLCHLSVSALRWGRCATLQWLLTPGQLRKM